MGTERFIVKNLATVSIQFNFFFKKEKFFLIHWICFNYIYTSFHTIHLSIDWPDRCLRIICRICIRLSQYSEGHVLYEFPIGLLSSAEASLFDIGKYLFPHTKHTPPPEVSLFKVLDADESILRVD